MTATTATTGITGITGFEAHHFEPDGPVTSALVDVCHSYVARRGSGVPVEVAKRHDGVAGPGWLLGVAVVRSDERQRIAETLELALAAGVGMHALGDCVTYVQLAAGLFAGQPVETVVEAATGRPAPTFPTGVPHLCGESIADAVTAGVWALSHAVDVVHVVRTLADVAPPSVGAAAAGLVGLRDGGGSVPAHWHRRLHCSAACLALAPSLVRARCVADAALPDGRAGASPSPLVVRATCSRSDRSDRTDRTERSECAERSDRAVRPKHVVPSGRPDASEPPDPSGCSDPGSDPCSGLVASGGFATPFLPQFTAADFLRRPLVGSGAR